MGTKFQDEAVQMKFAIPGNLDFSGPLMQCRSLQFGYERPLSQALNLDIHIESRIAFVGLNGSGKSALLRTIAQELVPLAGEVVTHPRLSVAHFSQRVADMFPLDKTACELMHHEFPDATPLQIQAHLTAFGLASQSLVQLKHLSGGEKSRCALACIAFRRPHILLLDEPTNHLDIQAVDALSSALKCFQGGLVLVSHDRRLIQNLDMDCFMLDGRCMERCKLEDFLESVDPEWSARLASRIGSALTKRLDTGANCGRVVQKLKHCGILTEGDMEILVHRIVESATARQTNIQAYVDLCIAMRDWCVERRIGECAHTAFHNFLQTACQSHFESYLHSADVPGSASEAKRRAAMSGTMRFLGYLIVRGQVDAWMLIVMSQSLLAKLAVPFALESLVTVLAVAGHTVDRMDWSHSIDFEQIFAEVQRLASGDGPDVPLPQTRRSLERLVDLRACGWRDMDLDLILNSE